MNISWQARLIKILMRVSGMKRLLSNKGRLNFLISWPWLVRDRSPPKKLFKRFRVAETQHLGRPVFCLQPMDVTPPRHVLYLHGGAYLVGIIGPHWRFVQRLMRADDCGVTIPLYGKAPEHGFEEGFELLKGVYQSLLDQYGAEQITVMGDSAGGGLSLAFAQRLEEWGLPQPRCLVLLSPWLDVSASDPDMLEVARRDPLLPLATAREAGRLWARDEPLTSPLVSPIYGSLGSLAPICLLAGTDDILLPEARRLRRLASDCGQGLRYLEYPGMFHVWMLFSLPESKTALQEVVAFIAAPDLNQPE